MNPELKRAAGWIAREGLSHLAPQILNPGMRLQWHAETLVAGRQIGRCQVFAGPPCGSVARVNAAFQSLDLTDQSHRKRSLWFGMTEVECESLGVKAERRIHLGDQAVLCGQTWSRRMALPASLRSQIRRAEKSAIQVHRIPLTPEGWTMACRDNPWLKASLLECRRQWLTRKALRPMGFMTACLEPEQEGWVSYTHRLLSVASLNETVVGYGLSSAIPKSKAVLVENLVRLPKAPNGLMELLIHHIAQWGLTLDCFEVNMGLAPLHKDSGIQGQVRISPKWFLRTCSLLRRFGEPLYRFRGLAQFKQRLHPKRWDPLYLVVPQDGFRPRDAFAIALAFFLP